MPLLSVNLYFSAIKIGNVHRTIAKKRIGPLYKGTRIFLRRSIAMAKDEHRKPATSAQAREDQLIAMAYDEVERRISEGIATGPELVHFLRMGSPKAKLEKELLERELELTTAKTENIKSQKKIEELYANAIEAMKSYGSNSDE